MAPDPLAISVRLSSHQASLIWPGLNFLVLANLTRKRHGQAITSYPFGILFFPSGFDSGRYNEAMMSHIDRLWDVLGTRLKTGGRLRLDVFGIRAAIFSTRLTVQSQRFKNRNRFEEAQRNLCKVPSHAKVRKRTQTAALKSSKEQAHTELESMKQKTSRLLRALERLAKRATRKYLADRSKKEFEERSREWRAHLRWIRYNLAYFKPFRPGSPDYRRLQWMRIDELVNMAKKEMERRRISMPNEKQLRTVARAFMRSCKQGYQGEFDFIYMLRNTNSPVAQSKLFEFFARRIQIEERR